MTPLILLNTSKKRKNWHFAERRGRRGEWNVLKCFQNKLHLLWTFSQIVFTTREEKMSDWLNFWKKEMLTLFASYFEHWNKSHGVRVNLVVLRCWWYSITVDFQHNGEGEKVFRTSIYLLACFHVVFPIREIEIERLIHNTDWLRTLTVTMS